MSAGAGVHFPTLPRRGLGIGLDLRWGDPVGFIARPDGSDGIAPALRAFLAAEAGACAHAFFSWQPRDRGRLRLADYAPGWDQLCALLPPALPRALHHTALNLAALGGAPRTALLDFTNALCERYGFGWINEDVGFWSVAGRPVPYPLPPLLDAVGLRACIRNVRECQRALQAPLVLEFPGFSAGVSLVMGAVDAYDFFRTLCVETAAPVTLDIAHLLSWRWWQGFRGEALYDELERLPLAHAFEIHLSGCEIAGERFIDAHHGRLLDEQLTLLERLLPLCPNLRAVTFEDPRVDETGALEPPSARSLTRLRALCAPWIGEAPPASLPTAAEESPTRPPEIGGPVDAAETLDAPTESALGALLFDSAARAAWRLERRSAGVAPHPLAVFATVDVEALEETAGAVRAMVRDRQHRGTGSLANAFPRTVAAWCIAHPDDTDLDRLFERFLSSPAATRWREWPGRDGGASLEECFADFAGAARLVDPLVCREELLSSMLRSLTVSPNPAFLPPRGVQRAPGGWFAVQAADPPVLHAALAGRYLCGPITPLVAALLGAPAEPEAPSPAADAPADVAAVREVRARLCEMGLLERQ